MFEASLFNSSLPNLHPAIVHFPVALLMLGVLTEYVAILNRGERILQSIVIFLYLAGSLAAALAWLTGRQAADSAGLLPIEAQLSLSEHSNLALGTALTFATVALGRLSIELLRDRLVTQANLVLRVLLLIAGSFGLWLLVTTADRGGSLVYTHGIGVRRPAPEDAESLHATDDSGSSTSKSRSSETSRAVAPVTRTNDGRIIWRPGPKEADSLGSVVEVLRDAFTSDIRVVEGDAALTLESHGTVLLLLPDVCKDLVMESDLDLSGFEGRVGLVHHFRHRQDYECFLLDSNGSAVLRGRMESLDEAAVVWPNSRTNVAISVTGSHLKGLVGGEVVTHAHRPARDDPGRVGLIFEGEGVIALHYLRVAKRSTSD